MTATQMMEKARSILIVTSPFYGHLALQLELVEDSTCDTAWTDGSKLGYNPEFIKKQTIQKLIGLNAHEVKHCAFGHHVRRGNRDKKGWNIAGDYVVNSFDDFELPDGALIDPQYNDMSAEEVYRLVYRPDPEGDEQAKGKDQPQDGSGDSDDQQANGSGDSGDGEESNDPGNSGEIRDAKNPDGNALSENEKASEEAKWKVAVAQAQQIAKARGDALSPALTRAVDEWLNPTIDWEVLLQRIMQEIAKNEYTWQRPNRAFLHKGLYFPSAHSNELGTVVYGMDSSISMNIPAFNRSNAELKHLIESTEAETYVIHCDNKINKVEHFEDGYFPEKLDPVGGGGTDFRPVFNWIEEEAIDPACLIYFTDCEGTYPDEEPPYPVIWLCSKKNPYKTPEFGFVLYVV